jgi:hypothetical protein
VRSSTDSLPSLILYGYRYCVVPNNCISGFRRKGEDHWSWILANRKRVDQAPHPHKAFESFLPLHRLAQVRSALLTSKTIH